MDDFYDELEDLPESNDKPNVHLIGEDGNVFAIIGKVSKALKREVSSEKAKEYQEKAMNSGSYDEVLRLTMDYVNVY